MRPLLRGFQGEDQGMSLVELLVVMVLLGVVGSMVSVAVAVSHKQVRVAEDEATGLADTRTVVERLGRDIRVSRGVDAGATDSNLVLWVDYNSDYVRNPTAQPEEIVTWTVLDSGSGTGQYNTLRSTAGGVVAVQARTLVSDLAFCYQSEPGAACFATPLSATDAAATTLVTVTLQYDSQVNGGTDSRESVFTERIRNVS